MVGDARIGHPARRRRVQPIGNPQSDAGSYRIITPTNTTHVVQAIGDSSLAMENEAVTVLIRQIDERGDLHAP